MSPNTRAAYAAVAASTTRPWPSLDTTRTDLDPHPRAEPDPPAIGICWPRRSRLQCPQVVPPLPASFASILEARRSNRALQPAPIREILNALAYATRPRFLLDKDSYMRSRRPAASAGSLHPIDIIIADWRGSGRLLRYNSSDHLLEILRVIHPDKLKEFFNLCAEILPDACATALVLIADQHKTKAFYNNCASLIWRDAGALLQVLALVATAYRLGFCPLGVLGGHIIGALALDPEQALAAGCGMIGR